MKRSIILSLICLTLSISCTEKKAKKKDKEINPFFKKAGKFRDNNEPDSAFFYYDKAKDFFLLKKDSLRVGKSLVQMGIIATEKGDLYAGREISLNAIPYLDQKEKDSVYSGANFNNIGIANYKLREYRKALVFYEKAIQITNSQGYKLVYLNNKAKIYEELKEFDKAIGIYADVLKTTTKNTTDYARALANLASTKWRRDSAYNPVPELLLALDINKQSNELWGQNLCYARLADYYGESNVHIAASYAHQMYDVASALGSPIDQLESLYKLVKVSPSNESKQYFVAYEKLNDSLQMVEKTAKNQFALVRYDMLELQKDNAVKKYQLVKQEIILLSTIAIVVFGVVFSIIWYRRRKKSLNQQKELEVKKTELKYVKKVHDRVANKVYNVMMEVENNAQFDKTILADKLETIYKISRDISYENNDVNPQLLFSKQLFQMLNTYASESIEITINGNTQQLWSGTSEISKSEVFNILQELMTNMMKHSQATKVQVDFYRQEEWINIVYLDNGVGIQGKPIYKNGLTNTGNRIAEINGTINFDNTIANGLKIEVSFPII